jgi:GntR family transcriptional regulator
MATHVVPNSLKGGTLLRALRLLRDEGLVELRQGHGIRVIGTPERPTVLAKVAELVQFGHRNGYTRTELARRVAMTPSPPS